jgi:hypothetical protein
MDMKHFSFLSIIFNNGGLNFFMIVGSGVAATYYYILMRKAKNPTQRAVAKKNLLHVFWSLIVLYALGLIFLLKHR